MEYLFHLAILICIYTILAQSLSLPAGYSGQMSLAHAGFYGIGAYTTALLSVNGDFPPLFNLFIAMLLSCIIAYVVSIVAVHTIDDYYIIITLGIQVVIFSIMNNCQNVTNGPLGIPSIPPFSIFGFKFDDNIPFLLLSASFSVLIWFLLKNIEKSPFGRVLRALSEDEIYTKSLGKNVSQAKIVSFVVSGMMASIAGVLYAHYITYIDPTSFTVDESIFILSIIIIGGMRNLRGIFFATAFLILFPEILRFIGMPSAIAANMRQIFYGIALVFVVYWNRTERTTGNTTMDKSEKSSNYHHFSHY